ncbi:MAG: phosphate signaling complex protein PhoU [Clostridiales bacterium]|nr:phosphate signaling complex protein PhoU [Clostridiales bacterium]HBM81341.1 phosphate transport system regulatory protein PhoU [Clostridiaceae bacterium]
MPRGTFDEELDSLFHSLIRMGGAVESQINDCIISLVEQDEKKALEVIDKDDIIDDMEADIEEACVKLIARQQPLAIDLRRIFTSIKIVTDLERIGDYAVDIARITIRLKDEKYIKPLIDIPRMADIVQKMIKDSLDAYIKLDVKASEEISNMDDEIDGSYKQVFRELLVLMLEDPRKITQATQFLFVCKFLERIGDHVTNICEWTIFLITGEHRDLND